MKFKNDAGEPKLPAFILYIVSSCSGLAVWLEILVWCASSSKAGDEESTTVWYTDFF